MTVAPHAAYFPDFLTPCAEVPDVETGAELVLATPSRRLRAEIGRLAPVDGPGATLLGELARGKPAALWHLRRALQLYCRSLIEPDLEVLDEGLRVECAGGVHRYLHAGPEGLLRWLGPATRWQPPVLVVDYPVDRDLFLDGRGLALIPSYFGVYHPVAPADPRLRPVLVFPIHAGAGCRPAGTAATT
ncbi:hypothetical protein AB0F15_42495 [Amycolatopsis sp. NPDC026612]|uniref:hypothetical protein n=1 Tax=Amycolatopsis sp. NPDC026612 TaxID=3155466 RepID=UPI00340FF8F5